MLRQAVVLAALGSCCAAQAQQSLHLHPASRQLLDDPPGPCDGHRCSGHSRQLVAHGWINGVTWGILFPVVIVLAHSLRRELSSWWFQLHRAIAFLALIGAIAGVASGAGLSNDDYHPNGAGGAHKALGIIALVAVVIQAVSTMVWRPLKGHKYRAIWDVGHHWLGRLAFALGVASFFLGIYIAAVGWGWYVAYGATVGAFLILMGLKDIIDTLTGHKIKSVTASMLSQRKGKKAAAVDQTTDIVASHTGDTWSENAGGLYPYLKTKRGKVNKGPDNIHSSIQLPARDGAVAANGQAANGHAVNGVLQPSGTQGAGVTLV